MLLSLDATGLFHWPDGTSLRENSTNTCCPQIPKLYSVASTTDFGMRIGTEPFRDKLVVIFKLDVCGTISCRC